MLIYMQDTYNVKYSDSVLSSSELSQSLCCPLLPGLGICSFAHSLFALLLIRSSLFCSKSLILKSNREQFALVIL